MVTTRKGSRLNAGKDNAETPQTPVANNGPSHAEDEASSHPSRRDEAPVVSPPPQPYLRGEPSGSLGTQMLFFTEFGVPPFLQGFFQGFFDSFYFFVSLLGFSDSIHRSAIHQTSRSRVLHRKVA